MLEIDFGQFFSDFLKLMWVFWPIWVFGLFFILIEYFFVWLKKWSDKKWLEKHKSLLEWKKIDPRKFERITAMIFEKLGYKTKVIGGAGDQGIDIMAHKDGKRIFIQCKKMDKVIPDDVRAFWGSIQPIIKEGEKGFLVTTGEFTREGKEWVKDKPIELINGLKLENLAKN